MAREVIIRMTDDFDRSQPADDTVTFAFEGFSYEVDLTQEHAEEFREFLQRYMDVAHEKTKLTKAGVPSQQGGVGTAKPPKPRSPEGETKEQRRAIRVWARENGFDVQDRGLLSQEIRDAYAAATGIAVAHNVVGHPKRDEAQLEFIDEIPAPKRLSGPKFLAANEPDANGVTKEMRDWARDNGHPVKNGYVKAKYREMFAMEQLEKVHATRNGATV